MFPKQTNKLFIQKLWQFSEVEKQNCCCVFKFCLIDYALCNLEADISKEHQDKLERLQV